MNIKFTLIALLFITTFAIIVFFLFQQDEKSTLSTRNSTNFITESEPPTLSEKELGQLWANGERCIKERFIINIGGGPNFFDVYAITVRFADDATCGDVERIAQILDAKIIGFEPVGNTYGFRNVEWVEEDIDIIVAQLEALQEPKIIGIFPQFSTILE